MGDTHPGNELPGYFQMSLRDKKIPFLTIIHVDGTEKSLSLHGLLIRKDYSQPAERNPCNPRNP
jgi:hypothetical protein